MNKLLSTLLSYLLVFSSFTTWLAINEYIRFNIFIIICIFFLDLICGNKKKTIVIQKNTKVERMLMLVFLVIVSVSFGVNLLYNYQSKLISNYLATLFIVGLLYFYYSSIIEKYITNENCIKALAYAGLLLITIITTDSILVNFFNIEIKNFFILGFQGNADYFRRTAWISPTSPTEEPGISALYLNMLIPFTLYYFQCWRKTILALFIFCSFSLFSSAGLFITLSGGLIIYILKGYSRIFIILGIILLILVVFYKIMISYEYVQIVIEQWNFIDKITLAGNSTSSTERSYGFYQAILDGLDSPFYGKGPGYGKSIIEVGYLSTFFSFLGNYGFIAFSIFCLIWGINLWKCFHLERKYKFIFIYSFYAISIGALIGDNLHNFALWMLLPIITKFYNNKKVINYEKNPSHS